MTDLKITEEPALDEILAPHQYGQVTIWHEGGDWYYVAMVRPGLPAEEIEEIKKDLQIRFDQLTETNAPEQNGWFPSSLDPGSWYMTMATYELPDMGFLEYPGECADEH